MSTVGEDFDTVVVDRGSASPPATSGEPSSSSFTSNYSKAQQGSATQKNVRSEENNGPKLRSSCRSCASSRVRCNKEKPTCSRCEARGIECQYLQSKRPGRVPGSGARRSQANQATGRPEMRTAATSEDCITAITVNDGTVASRNNIPKSFSSPAPSGLGMECPSIINHLRVDSISSAPDGVSDAGFFASVLNTENEPHANFDGSNFSSQVDSVNMFSNMDDITYANMTAYDTDLGDLNSWWPFAENDSSLSEASSMDFLAQFTSYSSGTDNSTESSSGAPSSLPSAVNINDLNNSVTSTLLGHETKQPQPTIREIPLPNRLGNAVTGSCHCMTKALDLLNAMSKAPSSAALPISGDRYTRDVLSENKQAIETTLVMLACRSCNEDKFLLMILLMIATKILTRYASAGASCGARTTSTSQAVNGDPMQLATTMQGEGSANSTSGHAERLASMSRAWGGREVLLTLTGDGSDPQLYHREGVQRVLRELHQAQRLIGALSLRRKSLGSAEFNLTGDVGMMDASSASTANDTDDNLRAGMPPQSTSQDSAAHAAATTPLSANALDVVEGDLRRSLSALSAVVRGVLRNS